MGRVTDAERREVAARLRGLDYSDLQESLICAYLDALGIEGYTDWVGIAHRLADLIDPDTAPDTTKTAPDTTKTAPDTTKTAPDTTKCDRDALLELADEMETDGIDCYTVSTQYVLDDYARRIREALGVEQ